MGWMFATAGAAGGLVFSQEAMQAASAAAAVFVNGVMPALFPMMVFSRLLPAGGGFVQAALFGFASGSPAAAQRLRLAALPGWQTEKLAALTGVMSPLFFTGTLAGWMQNAANGWRLLAVHWAAAIVTTLLWKPSAAPLGGKAASLPQEPFLQRLPMAIGQAAQALLAVCGAMMLFSILAALVRTGLASLFPAWTAAHEMEMAVLWALMEIGGGASAVLKLRPQPPLALLSALCGFGGISIWMQNLLFVGESIRPVRLLGMRMLHGAIAYGLGLMLF